MANRKLHNREAGYVAERMNPHVAGRKVVIYRAVEQGIDVLGTYAVVCDAHGTIASETSVLRARLSMKAPENFCEKCRTLASSGV